MEDEEDPLLDELEELLDELLLLELPEELKLPEEPEPLLELELPEELEPLLLLELELPEELEPLLFEEPLPEEAELLPELLLDGAVEGLDLVVNEPEPPEVVGGLAVAPVAGLFSLAEPEGLEAGFELGELLAAESFLVVNEPVPLDEVVGAFAAGAGEGEAAGLVAVLAADVLFLLFL
ncbi:hypothetical protein [Paenibacillus sp. FJAT-26967]|uniref:hypothetical protein n=1 Tax=Paenibacillus sp. FJAT-26967 TaxID=1729690 RepID=UPI0012E37713|nr:hypothetical protein [Paenibacillus sp. FJAT-26967]